jgi:hypothetical protein
MSEPYWSPEMDKLSECCGAISSVEITDNLGCCAECGEWSGFEKEEEK